MSEPSGGADDAGNAEGGEAADILRGGVRSGKFEGDLRAAERVAGKTFGAGIIAAGEFRANFEAVFRGELLDEAAHFAVADNGETLIRHCAEPVARSRRSISTNERVNSKMFISWHFWRE